MLCRIALLIVFSFYSFLIPAHFLQPSDKRYYIYPHSDFNIIFSEYFLKDKQDFFNIYTKLVYYNDIYKQTFPNLLSDTPFYIFASPHNQISNASTSSVPFLKTVFYPTGIKNISSIASIHWDETVISHEMAHIFQLGQVSSSLKYIKILFKNSEVIFLPIPIFLNVNLVLPLFLLEGHAVLYESLFSPGGRLYSGETRAFVFSQLKDSFKTTNHFLSHYLLNVTNNPFSIKQQYAHGGYFFNALLKKYNIKTINKIFPTHAEHFIAPFSFIAIKDTFETVFNTSFESLVHYYIHTYRPLALKQKQAPEKVLFESSICPPFNKKKQKIFFLSSNSKSTPFLRVFNTLKNKWKKQRKIFEDGKVFKLKSKYYVSSEAQVSTTKRVYGLFSEGMFLYDYPSYSIQDIYKNSVLSIDTTNNMRFFKLFLNHKLYDTVHSPALFDSEGNIYYFKQSHNQRVMYKNKFPLFQFEGFYGKPVEITKQGIYFIGASLLGSSLYQWSPIKGIQRMSVSDRIIDAVTISPKKALICEIGPRAYQYKISKLEQIPEQPVLYDYNFNMIRDALSVTKNAKTSPTIEKKDFDTKNFNENSFKLLSSDKDLSLEEEEDENLDFSFSKDSLPKPSVHLKEISYYHSIKNIQFSGIKASIIYDPITRYNAQIGLEFQDPLKYNSVNFSYQQSLDNGLFQINYTNKAHRLAWDIQYIYKQGLENFSGSRLYHYIHELSNRLSFSLFKLGYWSSLVSLKNAIAFLEFKDLPGVSEYYFTSEPLLKLQYLRSYNQNFDLHRHFILSAGLKYYLKISDTDYSKFPKLFQKKFKSIDLTSVNKRSNIKLQIQSHYMLGLGWEFYTAPFVFFQQAIKKKSIPFRYFEPLNLFENSGSGINFFLRQRPLAETNHYIAMGVHLKKFIDTPIYFSRFPVSLVGIAPLVVGKYLSFTEQSQKLLHFVEWTFGLKTQVLLHHKVKLNFNLYYGFSYPVTAKKLSINSSFANKSFSNKSYFGLSLQSGI